MNCPFCGKDQLAVVNSRATKNNTQIWRRRKCLACKQLVTTYEKIDLAYLRVEKSDGRVQVYNRAKLFSGIYQASMQIKKMDRGDRGLLTEEITSAIEEEILQLGIKIVPTAVIKNITLRHLKRRAPTIFLCYIAYFISPNTKNLRKILNKYL